MRIIAGKYKGRTLATLEGMNTRPMMDRMKESVFNILGPFFEGQEVLDLFGGSGALSLEAISRGCKYSHIVDASKEAMAVIEANVKKLGVEKQISMHLSSYEQALKQLSKRQLSFDIIFLDPPYRLSVMDDIISFLMKEKMIYDEGYIVCQYQKNTYQPKEYSNDVYKLSIKKNYTYAISEITIYQFHDATK